MDAPSSTNGPSAGNQTSAGQQDKLGQVQSQVEDVKIVMIILWSRQQLSLQVMSQNMTRILDRGERLENLDQQSQALQESVCLLSY